MFLVMFSVVSSYSAVVDGVPGSVSIGILSMKDKIPDILGSVNQH